MAWADKMQAMAEKIGTRFGADCTLRKVTPGAMNVSTGKRAETTADTTIRMIQGDQRQRSEFGSRTKVVQCTFAIETALLEAASITLDQNDRIVDGAGVVWRIERIEHAAAKKFTEVVCSRLA